MATTKKRINISVSTDIEEALTVLAQRDEVPIATKAGQLVATAIEIEEDTILDELAAARDTSDATFISHEDAWNELLK